LEFEELGLGAQRNYCARNTRKEGGESDVVSVDGRTGEELELLVVMEVSLVGFKDRRGLFGRGDCGRRLFLS